MITGLKPLDLQLFAGEKTEKATLKKRRDAREKGQVFRSVEINSAIILLASFFTIRTLFPTILESLKEVFTEFLKGKLNIDQVFTHQGLNQLAINILLSVGVFLGPFLLIMMVMGLVINFSQVGFLFTTKTIEPKLSKINPLEGFKRIFSKKSLVELAKSVIKLAIIAGLVYTEIKKDFGFIKLWYAMDLWRGVALIGDNTYNLVIKMAIVLFIFALFDYGYEWWRYETDLMMTKQEVKDEYKLTEGDPQVKSRIRGKQRELGMRRMMQEIPKADVVITNPTHYAVALGYDPHEDDAPIIIAKGQGFIALKIKEESKKHNITVVENKVLARALYASTEIGQAIPAELFHAVAEVLAFVYGLKGETV